MRKIGIMIGSDSDLGQCLKGLKLLKIVQNEGSCEIVAVITNSIHRNTEDVLHNLRTIMVDVWIIGAGMANHLTGTCEAYLRYGLQDFTTQVIGVAFEGKTLEETITAELSITQVPGTQVFYTGLTGEKGFLWACEAALSSKKLPKLIRKNTKPVQVRSLEKAILEAEKRRSEHE